MIDHFSILLTHALMLLAAWRLLRRADLDAEDDGKGGGGAGARRQARFVKRRPDA